jgi:hypothetical protein
MSRISRNGQEPIIYFDTFEDLEPAIRDLKAGRCDVDETSVDPLPSGHTSRRWGVVIKRRDEAVLLEPDPWDS